MSEVMEMNKKDLLASCMMFTLEQAIGFIFKINKKIGKTVATPKEVAEAIGIKPNSSYVRNHPYVLQQYGLMDILADNSARLSKYCLDYIREIEEERLKAHKVMALNVKGAQMLIIEEGWRNDIPSLEAKRRVVWKEYGMDNEQKQNRYVEVFNANLKFANLTDEELDEIATRPEMVKL